MYCCIAAYCQRMALFCHTEYISNSALYVWCVVCVCVLLSSDRDGMAKQHYDSQKSFRTTVLMMRFKYINDAMNSDSV